ncbi:tRNA1(Val) (adenine(37)-N6)-methyltransferase [Butyricimonas synergistica]|uniref:tRNA1(Val) (adenine(37)-N6)-methyltransferase n=1 Tax=Butyricimonas synergistica TaxID=544644 RepID=UPI00037C352E|nr:methyltransferase [Butyricimonas synergistica]
MANDYFQFKKFMIRQDKCAMKVGTDGVLLGAWADLTAAHRLLDIGTGTGLIAIMAAQRNSTIQIDAVEIDPVACEQAKVNVQNCPWKERIRLFQGRVQDFKPTYLYDVITCNPPFFINSTKNPELNRALARHCETLTHEDILNVAEKLLTPEGKLCVILPVPETEHFITLAQPRKWFVNKFTTIHPTPNKPPKRKLLEISRKQEPTENKTIILEIERHFYHETYAQLTKDFYLKL